MELKSIPADTRVLGVARPRFLPGGEEAVLVLHGFTGYPGEFTYLADRLHGAGFTVSVPRLPGHGTRGDDFLQTGWRDWLRRFTDAYLDLRAEYRTVHVAGLSMGGVIALLLAAHFDIPRIALMAPAVVNRRRAIVLAPLLRLLFRRMNRGEGELPEDPDLRAIAREYGSYDWPAQADSLRKLQVRARRELPGVRSATLVYVSDADESVPPEAADLILNGIASPEREKVHLRNSPHVMVNGPEREGIADGIIDWFGRTAKS